MVELPAEGRGGNPWPTFLSITRTPFTPRPTVPPSPGADLRRSPSLSAHGPRSSPPPGRSSSRRLVGAVGEHPADVALPVAVVERQQAFGGGDPTVGDLFQVAEIDRLVQEAAVQLGAVLQARLGDGDEVLGHVL